MSSKILFLNNSEEWASLLNHLPIEQQDIYFTPEYYSLYENYGDGKAQCFVFEKDGELALYPFLLNTVNALGYDLDKEYFDIQGAYGYNGVVASSNEKDFIESFFNSFNQYCKEENIVAEFTRFHPLINNKSFSEKYLQVVYDRNTIYIDLNNNYENIFKNFQTTTRKQIKRAINRYHIKIKVFENDINQLNLFTEIYHETMDRVQSVPYLYFNKAYFKSLIESTKNVCFVAYYESKPIASILAFFNQYYIHGHLGGALTDYLYMSPNSLLYSEMIKFGQSKGCHFFHVGGGTTSEENDPLLQFKMNFSNNTLDFYIGKKIYNKEVYKLIVAQWENKYPKKVDKYENFVLKYRY
ncbi:MAG: GNAT family N-acetyltransferase [Bacteroidetes bacterium]|nr:GNAT family N-acetyltransferase [Bacteroidota bacterium]